MNFSTQKKHRWQWSQLAPPFSLRRTQSFSNPSGWQHTWSFLLTNILLVPLLIYHVHMHLVAQYLMSIRRTKGMKAEEISWNILKLTFPLKTSKVFISYSLIVRTSHEEHNFCWRHNAMPQWMVKPVWRCAILTQRSNSWLIHLFLR